MSEPEQEPKRTAPPEFAAWAKAVERRAVDIIEYDASKVGIGPDHKPRDAHKVGVPPLKPSSAEAADTSAEEATGA